MKKWIFTGLGVVFVGFGAVGVFLPIWPTVPFILLAAGCFSIGNPKAYEKLAASPLFGEYIRNYKEKTGVTVKTKAHSLIFLWLMLGLSAWFSRRLWLVFVLAAVGVGVTTHILLLKTKRDGK
ncbi:MAG: YbaN family protein [Clostridiaceae bacterium]|nr:YbaN family protein [Clostridiaceae bacterium]